MRTGIDILVALVFVVVLVLCAALAGGAYSQHRHALRVNASVRDEMKKAIQDPNKAATPDLKEKGTQEIVRLQLAQEKLFDANTVSFIFQFVTLIILTIGISVLALMFSQYRREQERADKAEEARTELFGALAPFAAGQNACVVVASKYCLLYSLCRLYGATSGPERDSSLLMMVDYQNDILRHLEYALREKEGLEPLWHELILDLADRVRRMLLEIKGAAKDTEKASVERVVAASLKCRRVLWDNGEEFEVRYNNHWQKMTGKEAPARKWE